MAVNSAPDNGRIGGWRRALFRALLVVVLLVAGQPARAEWYYYMTDAVQTNTPPLGISPSTYCGQEFANWLLAYGSSLQATYTGSDPIRRPTRTGLYDGEFLLTSGNCNYSVVQPH